MQTAVYGDAVSQDNIGTPHAGSVGDTGKFDDYTSFAFCQHLQNTGRFLESSICSTGIRGYLEQSPSWPHFQFLRPVLPEGSPSIDVSKSFLIPDDDPILAEFVSFRHQAYGTNFARLYSDNKTIAFDRGREFSMHGNLINLYRPIEILTGYMSDMIWTEKPHGYEHYALNKHSLLDNVRFKIGERLSRYNHKAMYAFQYRPGHKAEHETLFKISSAPPEISEGVWASLSALGVTLNAHLKSYLGDAPALLARPDVIQKLETWMTFRDNHRALYEPEAREAIGEYALIYSFPSFLYEQFNDSFYNAPSMANLMGLTQAMEDAKLSYRVEFFGHPDFPIPTVTLEELSQYKAIFFPAARDLSDEQADLIQAYLDQGGMVFYTGEFGTRDAFHKLRSTPLLTERNYFGNNIHRVVEIMPGRSFSAPRSGNPILIDEAYLAETQIKTALNQMGLTPKIFKPTEEGAEIPKHLGVHLWKHEGFVSAHFVNQEITDPDRITATDLSIRQATLNTNTPVKISFQLPEGFSAGEARWLVPGHADVVLPLLPSNEPNTCHVEIPNVHVYGILICEPQGKEFHESTKRLAQNLARRISFAQNDEVIVQNNSDNLNEWQELSSALKSQLIDTAQQLDDARFSKHENEFNLLRESDYIFDFVKYGNDPATINVTTSDEYGAKQTPDGYSFGWLDTNDNSIPGWNETIYKSSDPYKGPPTSFWDPQAINRCGWSYWDFTTPLDQMNTVFPNSICSGQAKSFKIDLPEGHYRIKIIRNNSKDYGNNFRISSMVMANSEYKLFDVANHGGEFSYDEFDVEIQDEGLTLTFGGPTGWSLPGFAIEILDPSFPLSTSPLEQAGLREWKRSPSFNDESFYNIRDAKTPLDEEIVSGLNTENWLTVSAPLNGLPIVNLGNSSQTQMGEVVYVATNLTYPSDGHIQLELGGSSAIEVYMNGKKEGHLPNLHGLLEKERVLHIPVQSGENQLVLKLKRNWERQWMFYVDAKNFSTNPIPPTDAEDEIISQNPNNPSQETTPKDLANQSNDSIIDSNEVQVDEILNDNSQKINSSPLKKNNANNAVSTGCNCKLNVTHQQNTPSLLWLVLFLSFFLGIRQKTSS